MKLYFFLSKCFIFYNFQSIQRFDFIWVSFDSGFSWKEKFFFSILLLEKLPKKQLKKFWIYSEFMNSSSFSSNVFHEKLAFSNKTASSKNSLKSIQKINENK